MLVLSEVLPLSDVWAPVLRVQGLKGAAAEGQGKEGWDVVISAVVAAAALRCRESPSVSSIDHS